MISKHEKIKEIAKSRIHWSGGRLDILDYVDKQVELENAILEFFKIKNTIDKYERLGKKNEVPNQLWVKLRYKKKEIMKIIGGNQHHEDKSL